MKRIAVLMVLAGLSVGCSMFGKKDESAQGGGGDQANGKSGGDQGGKAGGGMDPFQFVKAPGRIDIGPDVKVGQMVQRTSNFGTPSVESYAVVGEDGDAWRIEAQSATIAAMEASFPELKGAIMGLTVKKSDGTVTKAVAGKPGEAGKPIEIMAAQAPAPATQPAGTPENVKIGIGAFDAKKYVQSGVTSWVGTAGDTNGVLIKMDGGTTETRYELAEAPKMQEVDVGGHKVKTRYTAYTNGTKIWSTEDPIICGLFGATSTDGKRYGTYKMEMPSGKIEITAIKTDAAPQLKW
jgi:hypothetical protein